MSTGLVTWNDVPKYFLCIKHMEDVGVLRARETLLCFFPTPVGWHFMFSISPQKQFTNIPHMFHLMCNVRHWFAGNHWTSGRPPTQMFNPRRWFSLFTLPNHVKPNLCLRFPWVFGCTFVTMLVCYVCFAVYTVFGLQRKQKCRPSSWWNSWTLTGHASCWTLAVLVSNMSPPTVVGKKMFPFQLVGCVSSLEDNGWSKFWPWQLYVKIDSAS